MNRNDLRLLIEDMVRNRLREQEKDLVPINHICSKLSSDLVALFESLSRLDLINFPDYNPPKGVVNEQK